MVDAEPHASILYAEDDALLRVTITELLEAEGWRVEACADGLAALARLEGAARYDLLLFDNAMPGASGLELAARSRTLAHREGTPVVLISASDCALEARRVGAVEFLRKPEDVSRLVAVVASLVGARR
jgi:CheY-like chemotaxis protein